MDDGISEYLFAFLFFAALGLFSFILWRFFSVLRSQDLRVRKDAKRKARLAIGCLVIAIAGLAIAAKVCTEVDLRIGDAGRFATRRGRTIQLHPSDIIFQVPQDWLDWDAQFHNNLHLSHRELRSVRTGHGEWDSEYGSVVNASLPFEHCAAHVGGEGWGWQGASFGDLQVRAYITSLSRDDVLLRVKTQSLKVAQSIAERQGGFAAGGRALFSTSTQQEWQHATITYPLWYGDYGGTAPIDFYVRDVGRYRLVLVFMGRGGENEKDSILNSVTIPVTTG
jgi:hypothetical protein